MRFVRTLATLAVMSAATVGGISAVAPASAVEGSLFIVDGEAAPPTPWAVQILPIGCSGSQINDSWILTARHCVFPGVDVYHSNSTVNRGPKSVIDKQIVAPDGDVALMHMRDPFPLKEYPQLDLGFTAQGHGSGVIMGYGLRANREEPDQLYQAEVDLIGASKDAASGKAQHIAGVTGAANHGDSGGPLIVGNRIVGVCSTGDTADPGADPHSRSNYALISQTGDWITTTIAG